MPFRTPTVLSSSGVGLRKETKNVVIFGETGVGKSSLINLIADEKIAETSSSAVGCTLEYKRHLLTIDGQRFAIWDTAGLDEGTEGTVPAEKAEAYLKQLLRALVKTSGIDLLIYCVRGTRTRSALLTNYHLFYTAICRKKVPIAIVITGLENQEVDMETWWRSNERQFTTLQMHFDGHACVTTLQSNTENAILRERRKVSRIALIKMIKTTYRTEQWKPNGRSWINTAFSDVRAILSPKQGDGVHVASVILCDATRNSPVRPEPVKRSVTFHIPVTLSFSWTQTIRFRRPVTIMDEKAQNRLPFDDAIKRTPERVFRLYQVPCKQSTDKEDHAKGGVAVQRGADLLIFSVRKEEGECREVKLQWEHFNLTYGGDLSPQIVVVIGAVDQPSAEEWWNKAVDGAVAGRGASVAYWPSGRNETITETETAKRRLRELVNTRCIDCSKAKFTGDKRIFARRATSYRLNRTRSRTRARRDNSKESAVITHQDILTKWGVWDDVRWPVGKLKTSRAEQVVRANSDWHRSPFLTRS